MRELHDYTLREEVVGDKLTRTMRARTVDNESFLIKSPRTDYLDPLITAQLRHEYEVSRRLNSEGILRVHDFDAKALRGALIYEDFDGIPLRSFLAKRKVALQSFFKIALQLVDALREIHRQHIVHNNISSHNILIQEDLSRVKLTDFSLSSLLALETSERWKPVTNFKSLEYISPEQTGRMNRPIDYRTDFYSLGVVFYEILIGWLPFQTEDPMELVHAHIAKVPARPHDLNASIPEPVSQIILKLMEKNSENRYQSCEGLHADLLECETQWRSRGVIASFALGSMDTFERFLIPQKLYGREAHAEILSATFRDVCNGATRFVLISGYSGIGKTSLIHETHKDITRSNGQYLAGKFDQLQRGIPYASLVQAFQEFVVYLLSTDEESLMRWRDTMLTAVGVNARILIDVIPDLALVIGAQPEMIPLPEKEAQNRFHSVLLKFVQLLAQPEHPLTLFLDDLQWTDAASLDFILRLLAHPETHHLLLICAYRENEVHQRHPVMQMIEEVKKNGMHPEHMQLQPLQTQDVIALVADTLHLPREQMSELGALIHQKTQGNPFFVGEFFKSLYAKKLLRYHVGENRWQWEMAEILRENITDNVAELMMGKIHTLSQSTQRVLSLASCIGSRFELHKLSIVNRETPARTALQLWEAIHAGLIVPIDEAYRLYQYSETDAPSSSTESDTSYNIEYKFLHDRVQQAAYGVIPEQEKKAMHLSIGKVMAEALPDHKIDEAIFDIVNHFNAAIDLLTKKEERIEVAEMNLRAARKARTSAAYESAYHYANKGLSLVFAASNGDASRLYTDLLYETGVCEYLTNRFTQADAHFDQVLNIAPDNISKAKILSSKIVLYTYVPRIDESIAMAVDGLRLLGYSLHRNPNKLHVGRQLAFVHWLLRGKKISSLAALPEMTDPSAIVAIELMHSIIAVAYFQSAEMYALLILNMMEIVLRKGVTDSSGFVFAQYAAIIGAGMGKYERAVEFGRLAIDLGERFPHQLWNGRVKLTLGVFIIKWYAEIRKSAPVLLESFQLAVQTGDNLYGIWANSFYVMTRLFVGDALEEIRHDVQHALQFAKEANNTELSMLSVDLFIRALTQPADDQDATPQHEERRELERTLRASNDVTSRLRHATNNISLAFFLRSYDASYKTLTDIRRDAHGMLGQVMEIMYLFFGALVLCEMYRRDEGWSRSKTLRIITKHRKKLGRLSHQCSVNYQHLVDILDVEIADIRGETIRALRLIQPALESAAQFGSPMYIAITHECAARLYHRNQWKQIGDASIRDAHQAYKQWGAVRKVRMLETEFPDVFRSTEIRNAELPTEQSLPNYAELSTGLDVMTFIKASHAISAEIVLEKLLRTLISIILQNAGAERGLLLLEKNGKLYVEAEGDIHNEEISVLRSIPLLAAPKIPTSIVHFVERSRRPVVLASAYRQHEYSIDPYIHPNKILSILCMPLLYQSRLSGILYLENNLIEGAFTPERIDVLNILTTEIATAIENARLYADLETAKEKIEEYSRTLEQKVEDRTRDLQRQSEELEKTIVNLHATQQQLIHAEKMATLGELTAGIAHEIKNPLNFVNNFSELSVELLDELRASPLNEEQLELVQTAIENLSKITQHGKRADVIIRGMMQHARGGSGEKHPSNINELLEKSIDFTYNGMRANDSNFELAIVVDYDPTIPLINVVPQDISRVFLNILNNAMYAATHRTKPSPPFGRNVRGSEGGPTIHVSTSLHDHQIEIRIRDDGDGIPDDIKEKIFQPFFTTKPAGQGTGLGLSLSYDIVVKGHGGSIDVNSATGEYTEFIIALPAGS